MAFTEENKKKIDTIIATLIAALTEESGTYKSTLNELHANLVEKETAENWGALLNYLLTIPRNLFQSDKSNFQSNILSTAILKLKSVQTDCSEGNETEQVISLAGLSPNSSAKTTLPASSPHTSPASLVEVNVAETVSVYSGKTIRHTKYPDAFFTESEHEDRMNKENNTNYNSAIDKWLKS